MQDGLDVGSRSGLAPRFCAAAYGCSWFPRLGVQQAPAHGCDQEGGEDDTQGQGADVGGDLGADGHGQRPAGAHDGRLTQPQRVRLAVRERPDNPDRDQGQQRSTLSDLLDEPESPLSPQRQLALMSMLKD